MTLFKDFDIPKNIYKPLLIHKKMKKRERKKRGLSPVIATVLLIGIVVVIALIVFTWFRGFTQEAVTKFDQNAQLVCNDIEFKATLSGGSMSIVNLGNIPIYSMLVKMSGTSGFETRDLKELTENWPDGGLNVGGAFEGNFNEEREEILLIPILRGNSQKGGEASFACEERQGYRVS